MARGDSYQLQGQGGGVVVGAGSSMVGNFRWIQVVNDTVLDDLTSDNVTNLPGIIDPVILPAGLGIGGSFSSISVATGLVIAYYA